MLNLHEYPIAVIIPAYKAERKIRDVLAVIPDFVTWIVVVDDCSPDGTAQILSGYSDSRVVVVTHAVNQGVGGAMLSGYRRAVELGARVLVKMDSDGQMDPAYLRVLLGPILRKEADYTKGNRFLHETELKQMPLLRRIGNLGLSFLNKLASGYWNIFDPTNGYTALTSAAFKQLDLTRISRRYFFESSMLIELGRVRAVVKDVAIPAIYADEKSSLSVTKTLFEFPPKLFMGFLRRIFYLYLLRDFSAVSLMGVSGIVGVAFGTTWGIVKWIHSNKTGIPASTGTVMIAVLPLILGIQFLLQALLLDIQNVPVTPISLNEDEIE